MFDKIDIASIALLTAAFSFFAYWGVIAVVNRSSLRETVIEVVIRRILGFLLFGIIPLMIAFATELNLSFTSLAANDLLLFFGILVVFTPIIFMATNKIAKSKEHQQRYGETLSHFATPALFNFNSFLWILYLIGYEFLFRGVLLFGCAEAWGVVVATVINVVLYAIVHIPRGKFEVLGAIPLGVLFCVITFATNTFWTVVILHCLIAISHDINCIKHSEIKFANSN